MIAKTYTEKQTGQKIWDKTDQTDENSWTSIFRSVKTNCKEMKLREFQFKFLHRTVVTRKELFKIWNQSRWRVMSTPLITHSFTAIFLFPSYLFQNREL